MKNVSLKTKEICNKKEEYILFKMEPKQGLKSKFKKKYWNSDFNLTKKQGLKSFYSIDINKNSFKIIKLTKKFSPYLMVLKSMF